MDTTIDLLAELDNVSRIHTLDRETIDDVMLEMARRIVVALRIERMSVWLLNKEGDALVSMGEYDARTREFHKETRLSKSEFPEYFHAIDQNRILYAEDVRTHPDTRCLNEAYSLPNDVITLLDIPLRLEGKLIGVMCYEKTGDVRKAFSSEEKAFAFSVSVVFVSNLEARYRRAAQHSLEKTIKEKELLIKEMNHRVKNNFAILISLLRISKEQGSKQTPREILEEYQQRIFSMMKIHDLLFESGNYHLVNLREYLVELSNEFSNSHPELTGHIHTQISEVDCIKSSREALYIGLIITEIFINAVKHVAVNNPDFTFNMRCYVDGEYAVIELEDNGPGFDFASESARSTLGLSLIHDLASELEFPIDYPKVGRSLYRLRMRV